MTTPQRLAAALLDAVTARHPYRDAIRGDLEEEFAARTVTTGRGAASVWFVREALRTAATLLRDLRIPPIASLRIVIAAFLAYLGLHWADRVSPEAVWQAGLAFSSTAGRIAALTYLAAAAASAGWLVVRATREPLASSLALLALLMAVAARYLSVAHGPFWFDAGKAALLCLGAAIGAGLGARSASRRQATVE